ncbi:hypothetical protein [Streptomyces sp. NPDC001889]
MSVLLTPPGPELRLLVSLAAWSWPGTRPDGREIAHILITHTPALTGSGPAETAEARMRRLPTRRSWTSSLASPWSSPPRPSCADAATSSTADLPW